MTKKTINKSAKAKLVKLRDELETATVEILPTEKPVAQQEAHEKYYHALAKELGYTIDETGHVIDDDGMAVNIAMMEARLEIS